MRRITRLWIIILALALLAIARRPSPPPGLPLSPITLIFTGDILLAGRVGGFIEQHGPAAPFEGVTPILRGANLAVGNLECALATGGKPARKTYTFRADPASAEALRSAGFDVMTLANNHSVDYGQSALLETVDALHRHGIRPVGAGRDRDEAARCLVIKSGSPPIRVAVLAFSNMLPVSFYAGRARAGTNPALGNAIVRDIGAARSQADLVVALFHWGDELSPTPSPSQRYLADLAVKAGADLVVGHHPHVLQGLERRGHALIAYSLGNFLFPSRGASARSMMLRYRRNPDGSAAATLVPCVIEDFRPMVASGKEREAILSTLRAQSAALGTKIGRNGGIVLPPRPAEKRTAVARPSDAW